MHRGSERSDGPRPILASLRENPSGLEHVPEFFPSGLRHSGYPALHAVPWRAFALDLVGRLVDKSRKLAARATIPLSILPINLPVTGGIGCLAGVYESRPYSTHRHGGGGGSARRADNRA